MQLNITTDYAIRIILYLSMKGGIVTSGELSENMKVPQNYVLKITRKLSKAGFIKIYHGNRGGFSIIKKPAAITLLEIIETMEITTKINYCMEAEQFCSRDAIDSCPVRKFYCQLQRELNEKLSTVTIVQLLENAI